MTAPPASWVVEGTWPTGRLADGAPAAAARIATAARRVTDYAPTEEQARALMLEAGVSAEELFDLVTGSAWPTFDLLVRLEVAIGTSLW